MASAPQPSIYGVGTTVTAGQYPIFASKDAAGNYVLPFSPYFWNPNGGASGTWIPRAITSLVSTAAVLAANAPFTSAIIDISTFASLAGTVYSDQSGTLSIQQSYDGTNWDAQYTLTFTAGSTSNSVDIPVIATNMRIVYTNGATAQTAFRLTIGGRPL